jgi:hypothetical protein
MNIEKMQAEFEAAISEKAGEPLLAIYLSRRGDTYSTSTLHFAWWAWQASRTALLKKQAQEQEEFLAHLADFEQEDTLHG